MKSQLAITRGILAVCFLVATAFGQQRVGNITVAGTAGNGYAELANQASAPATPTSAIRLYADSLNQPAAKDASGNVSQLLSQKTGVITVANIAALRAYPVTNLVNGATIFVQGYYAANDGAGLPPFTWNATSTATDNSGTIIAPTGVVTGRWLLQYSGAIDAKWFGCYGDGIHDDTAALANFIGAIAGLSGYMPAGTYNTTATITLNTSGTQLLGERLASTGLFTGGAIIAYSGNATAVVLGQNNLNALTNYVDFENIKISTTTACTCDLECWQLTDSTVRNVAIYGNSGSSVGINVNGGVNNLFEFIDINGSQGAGSPAQWLNKGFNYDVGFSSVTATNTTLRKCYFHQCQYGLYQISSYLKCDDCIFETNNAYGVNLNAIGMLFVNCWWENNTTGDGYFSQNSATFVKCHFDGYARTVFFSGFNPIYLDFVDSDFVTASLTPTLFGAISQTGSVVNFSYCNLPTGTISGGNTPFPIANTLGVYGTGSGVFSTLTSNVSTGTAPLTVTSTTVVPNLNSSLLLGKTWAVPAALGSTTPSTIAFTTGSSAVANSFTYIAGSAGTFNGVFSLTNNTSGTGKNAFMSFGNPSNASAYFGFVQNASGFADVVWNQFSGSFAETLRLTSDGNLQLGVAGKTLQVKSGANAMAGTVTLSGGSATITSTAIDANTVILFSEKTAGGTPGIYQPLATVSAGSATVTSAATDNSTYNWIALKVN